MIYFGCKTVHVSSSIREKKGIKSRKAKKEREKKTFSTKKKMIARNLNISTFISNVSELNIPVKIIVLEKNL